MVSWCCAGVKVEHNGGRKDERGWKTAIFTYRVIEEIETTQYSLSPSQSVTCVVSCKEEEDDNRQEEEEGEEKRAEEREQKRREEMMRGPYSFRPPFAACEFSAVAGSASPSWLLSSTLVSSRSGTRGWDSDQPESVISSAYRLSSRLEL